MQQPMDMGMQQPMMQQPAMPMQQPMDSGLGMPMQQPMMQQQPIQPAIAEPAFMPPQLPQSLQPQGFNDGGFVDPYASTIAEGQARAGDIDIGQTAGTVVEAPAVNIDEDLVATARDLERRLEEEPPYAIANKILSEAEKRGSKPTGDTQPDLAAVYESLTGDPAAYEKNIDELNRGIIGAAIASGTSARATENIAKGLLVGMEGAKATEERRATEARALQVAAAEARALEAKAAAEETKAAERAKAEAEAKLIDDMRGTYQAVYDTVFGGGILTTPPGENPSDYAAKEARRKVAEIYGEENAARLFGAGAATPSPAATSTPTSTPTLEQFIAAARTDPRNANATDEQLTEFYNNKYGG